MTPPPDAAPFVPDVEAWRAWGPDEVARRLQGVCAPWCVAAGWAIDLFLGEPQRVHDDLEIAAPHECFGDIAVRLPDCDLFVVGDGHAVPLAQAGRLGETWHQTWVRERATGFWRLDIFREPSADGQWVCRRDARIQLPYEVLIEQSTAGIPYTRPEVVLLFKAKATRPKDDADFAAVLPHLGPERRVWLAEVLDLVHPGHRWRDELRDDASHDLPRR